MSSFRRFLSSTSLLILSSYSFAQAPAPEAPAPPPPAWTGAAQASFLGTSGNTETSVLGLGAEAKYKGSSPWSLGLKAGINRGSLLGKENLKNLMAAVRAARALDDRTDLFVEGAYAQDVFAGIDSRLGGELGIARKLSIKEPHLLTIEAGLGGAREARLPSKIAKSFATLRGGLGYKYIISKTADFQEQVNYTANLSDTNDWRLTNVAALTAALSSRFSLKLSHTLSRLNSPALGKKKSDSAIAAALVAKF